MITVLEQKLNNNGRVMIVEKTKINSPNTENQIVKIFFLFRN